VKSRSGDPEIEMLAAIAGLLKEDRIDVAQASPWSGSPFSWILKQSSEERCRIGKQLIVAWCAAKGLKVTPSPDPVADRVIGGQRVIMRSATLWKSGIYRFRRIPSQEYDYAICLGISPFAAHCWVIPKDLLNKQVIGVPPRRRGRDRASIFSLSVRPADPQEWLKPCGGTLARGLDVLRGIGKP